MTIGTGVGFIVVGAILYWAVELNVPYLFEGALGVIAMIVGLTIIAATFVVSPRAHGTVAGGLTLAGVGAALAWAVDIDLPFVYDGSLGLILMFAGIVAVVAAAVMDFQHTHGRHDVEYRYSDGSAQRTRFWPIRR